MSKLINIIVECCRDCPFFNDIRGYDFFCLKQLRSIDLEESDSFPEWCPLPDVDEVKE